MKRFLSITIGLSFLWVIGSAQSPVNGTISVGVVKHLEISIVDPHNINFVYNEAFPNGPPATDNDNSTDIGIKANVNWKLSVSSVASQLTNLRGDQIPVSQFKFYPNNAPVNWRVLGTDCLVPVQGSLNTNFQMIWETDPHFGGNMRAGVYTVGITYLLTEAL